MTSVDPRAEPTQAYEVMSLACVSYGSIGETSRTEAYLSIYSCRHAHESTGHASDLVPRSVRHWSSFSLLFSLSLQLQRPKRLKKEEAKQVDKKTTRNKSNSRSQSIDTRYCHVLHGVHHHQAAHVHVQLVPATIMDRPFVFPAAFLFSAFPERDLQLLRSNQKSPLPGGSQRPLLYKPLQEHKLETRSWDRARKIPD